MASTHEFSHSNNSNSSSPLAPFLIALAVIIFFYCLIRLYKSFVLRPASLRRALLDQDIHVKPYRLLSGDLAEMNSMEKAAQKAPIPSASDHHLVFPYLFPFLHRQISEDAGYGTYEIDRPLMLWNANNPLLVLTNPEDVKCVMLSDVKHLWKPATTTKIFQVLVGETGLLLSNGDLWQNHRILLRPAFFVDKLKEMVPAMVTSALGMVEAWNQKIKKDGQPTEMEVAKDIKDATADILARTSFGSSYIQGKSVFNKQVEILELIFRHSVKMTVIPGYRYIPTSNNRKLNKLEKSIKLELAKIVEARRLALQSESEGEKTDLLGLMLTAEQEAHQGGHTISLTTEQIIDESRTFFFAGHETTANLLAWTMVLLSLHPEWQEKAREEVLEICGKGVPKADHLSRMKIVSMVLNETLRLYPPVPQYLRRTVLPSKGNFRLGDRTLPEGTEILVPCLFIHRRKDLWGEDADEFNPERFSNGITKACKHPYAFIPFSQGPRVCIGQNFALMEAKVVMAVILQRFRFKLSPNYRHSPMTTLTMRPRYGVQVLIQCLL